MIYALLGVLLVLLFTRLSHAVEVDALSYKRF